MQHFRITLAYTGVDLDDEDLIDRLAEVVPEVHWMSTENDVHALLYVEGQTARGAVEAVTEAVRRIVPAARALRVVEDFVAIPDIAQRAGVNRETVRTWVTGARGPGDFPRPRGVVGNGIRVWDWASVNAWLQRNYTLGDDVHYLTAIEVAHVNEWLVSSALREQLSGAMHRTHAHQPRKDWAHVQFTGAGTTTTTLLSERRAKLAAGAWPVAS